MFLHVKRTKGMLRVKDELNTLESECSKMVVNSKTEMSFAVI